MSKYGHFGEDLEKFFPDIDFRISYGRSCFNLDGTFNYAQDIKDLLDKYNLTNFKEYFIILLSHIPPKNNFTIPNQIRFNSTYKQLEDYYVNEIMTNLLSNEKSEYEIIIKNKMTGSCVTINDVSPIKRSLFGAIGQWLEVNNSSYETRLPYLKKNNDEQIIKDFFKHKAIFIDNFLNKFCNVSSREDRHEFIIQFMKLLDYEGYKNYETLSRKLSQFKKKLVDNASKYDIRDQKIKEIFNIYKDDHE